MLSVLPVRSKTFSLIIEQIKGESQNGGDRQTVSDPQVLVRGKEASPKLNLCESSVESPSQETHPN